ncbi:MAG: hypothetical protein AAGI11_00365 [Pseudomonadota bacterium]
MLPDVGKIDWLTKASIVAGAALILKFLAGAYVNNNFFWDMRVYTAAATAFAVDGSAYSGSAGDKFVYAPYILLLFSLLQPWLAELLLLGYVAVLIALLTQPPGRLLVAGACLASFWFSLDDPARAAQTGNITPYLHALVLVGFFHVQRRSGMTFLTAVVIASLFKPYFLAYLLLLGAVPGHPRDKLGGAIVAISLTASVYAAQWLHMPDLFSLFLDNLRAQVIGDTPGPGRDVGLASYYVYGQYFQRPMALLLHTVSVGLVFALLMVIYTRSRPYLHPDTSHVLLFCGLLIVCILLNPRLKVYDWWIMQTAAVAMILVFLGQGLFRSWWMLVLALLCFVYSETLLSHAADFASSVTRLVLVYSPLCIAIVMGLAAPGLLRKRAAEKPASRG